MPAAFSSSFIFSRMSSLLSPPFPGLTRFHISPSASSLSHLLSYSLLDPLRSQLHSHCLLRSSIHLSYFLRHLPECLRLSHPFPIPWTVLLALYHSLSRSQPP